MCGISVVIRKRGGPVDHLTLLRAISALQHRGPDGTGLLVHENVGLGHARLSIVDPVGGAQPIIDREHRCAIVCNGEVYNHLEIRRTLELRHGVRFLTASDSEVILHAYRMWPETFVERLEGMFAFALLDVSKKRVVLARDRLGIKPLYSSETDELLVFGSEIKSLLQHPGVDRGPASGAVSDVLTFGYPMGEQTVFRGISSFCPGTVMVVDSASAKAVARKYWSPVGHMERVSGERSDPDQAIEAIRESIQQATKTHTMGTSKYGIYLSGGLDCSILALLLAKERVGDFGGGFSLSFPGTTFDESALAAAWGMQLSMQVDLVPDSSWTFTHLRRAVFHLEQPQIVTLDVSMNALSHRARNAGCKYVFAGDGADELLGGYDHFSLMYSRQFSDRFAGPVMQSNGLRWCAQNLGYPDDFIERYLSRRGAWADRYPLFSTSIPWFPVWMANAEIAMPLMLSRVSSLDEGGGLFQVWEGSGASLLQDAADRATVFELNSRLPNWILLKSDRNAMANGIEVRVPYLDNSVMEAMLSSPANIRSIPMNAKWALKQAFRDALPDTIANQRKRAFNTPHNWVFRDCKAELDYHLSKNEIERLGIFDPAAVTMLRRGVEDAYMGVTQPNEMMSALRGQTLLGVITTQILFDTDFSVSESTVLPFVDLVI